MQTKLIDVKIAGENYRLTVSEKDEVALMQAVKVVDAEMLRIRDTTQTKNQERVAVMAAIRFAGDLLTLRNTHVFEANSKLNHQIAKWNENLDQILHHYEQI
jgi:cell division protein ZapA